MNKEKLSQILNCELRSVRPVGGGCIGDSEIVTTNSGESFFIKSYPGRKEMIDAEYKGLTELAKPGAIRIPEVISYDSGILILEYINQGRPSKNFWTDFGSKFAKLHKYQSENFGFHSNNFIGSTPQINNFHQDWIEFFFEHRLRFQAKLAVRNGYADSSMISKIDAIESKSGIIFASGIKASLLHGDLWSGNYLVDEEGEVVLIDPAVYYGDREADLAMTKLFGSFGSDFYQTYNEEYPLLPGYSERENLYKLYHILNHLNLFGSGYYSQANSIINYYL